LARLILHLRRGYSRLIVERNSNLWEGGRPAKRRMQLGQKKMKLTSEGGGGKCSEGVGSEGSLGEIHRRKVRGGKKGTRRKHLPVDPRGLAKERQVYNQTMRIAMKIQRAGGVANASRGKARAEGTLRGKRKQATFSAKLVIKGSHPQARGGKAREKRTGKGRKKTPRKPPSKKRPDQRTSEARTLKKRG